MADDASSSAATEKPWGRVLICGGTDWPRLGRKEKPKAEDEEPAPDLLEPHILRALADVQITSLHSSGASCHFVALARSGDAFVFGRNTSGALGVPPKAAASVSENAPRRVKASALPGGKAGEGIVHAACGRAHTLLVGSGGQVWAAGGNGVGQCGQPPCAEIPAFKLVKGPWTEAGERVVMAAAGISFSLVLTDAGRVFAFGSGQYGQLGNGRTGEHIVSAGKSGFDVRDEPVLVKGLDGKKIVQIACGQQHSVALADGGFVYVWGYNGYCRLGLGNQQDVLMPKLHPHFAGPTVATMGARIAAGPACSVVVDKQGMYWIAGKWKNSGDGSSGQPFSSFRFLQDIMTCKMTHATCGGVTLFALAPEDDGSVLTIAWGQNASNGELGLGPDEPKSATKPVQCQPLAGLNIIDVAAGQNTTLFLVRPSEKSAELPRHPVELDAPELCVVCGSDEAEGRPLLACDKCDSPCHPDCAGLPGVPDGEWFCKACVKNPGAPVGPHAPPLPISAPTAGRGKRRAASEPEEEEEDEDEDEEVGPRGGKRKTAPKGRGGGTKRKK